jgi:hypothetical protein
VGHGDTTGSAREAYALIAIKSAADPRSTGRCMHARRMQHRPGIQNHTSSSTYLHDAIMQVTIFQSHYTQDWQHGMDKV